MLNNDCNLKNQLHENEGRYKFLVEYPYDNSSLCKHCSRISSGKIRHHRFPSPPLLLENRSVIIHSFPRARTPTPRERYTQGLDACSFVTLDPRLSPLTGSRTSGPAIFAIYLLLVIGLTGESQAEHKRMLFMDAWKKRRERTGLSYGGNPCSIEPNDFSLLDRFLKCCQVLRTLFESCCCFNSFLFSKRTIHVRRSLGLRRMRF